MDRHGSESSPFARRGPNGPLPAGRRRSIGLAVPAAHDVFDLSRQTDQDRPHAGAGPTATHPKGTEAKMRVQFVAKENGPERLVCDAEILFGEDAGPSRG